MVYHMCLWSRSSKGASYAYCSTVCTHKRLFLIPFSSGYFWPFLGIFTDPCTILTQLENDDGQVSLLVLYSPAVRVIRL